MYVLRRKIHANCLRGKCYLHLVSYLILLHLFFLGVGDVHPHSGPQRVPINVAIVQVAAGSNHTVLLSGKGEVYCFGNYQVLEYISLNIS